LVFPVAPLAVRQPFDRLRYPPIARLRPLRIRDPFDIFAPIAGTEARERRSRRRIAIECGLKFGRNDKFRPGMFEHARRACAAVDERDRARDQFLEYGIIGQIIDRGHPSELPHRLFRATDLSGYFGTTPETESRMRLE